MMHLSVFVERLGRRGKFGDGFYLQLITLLIGAAGFAVLAWMVTSGTVFFIDSKLLQELRTPQDSSIPVGPWWLQKFMIDVTALGGVSVIALLTALVAFYLLARRQIGMAVFLTATVSLGAAIGTLLKQVFDRPRPDVVTHLADVATTSFPSAHAMNSAILYLTLSALLAQSHTARPVKIYVFCAGIVLTFTIGFSRVYLGVHWPSDVVAGWCAGGVWALLCSMIARRITDQRMVNP